MTQHIAYRSLHISHLCSGTVNLYLLVKKNENVLLKGKGSWPCLSPVNGILPLLRPLSNNTSLNLCQKTVAFILNQESKSYSFNTSAEPLAYWFLRGRVPFTASWSSGGSHHDIRASSKLTKDKALRCNWCKFKVASCCFLSPCAISADRWVNPGQTHPLVCQNAVSKKYATFSQKWARE